MDAYVAGNSGRRVSFFMIFYFLTVEILKYVLIYCSVTYNMALTFNKLFFNIDFVPVKRLLRDSNRFGRHICL